MYTGYLEKLTPHLCDVYKRTRFVPKQHLWPPDQPKLFKNLTFLRHDSQFKQQHLSHIAAKYRRTFNSSSTKSLNFDINNTPMFKELEQVHLSICKSNATKNIGDLFSDEENLKPRSILVEGAPGVGKTELIKEITYLWAKSELLCDMKVVFGLCLCDPGIHNLKSIENFIHRYVNHENRYLSTKEAEGVVQELRDSRGSSIAFMMDGFDEFPSRVYQSSFVAGLISGEVLPNALLLITSRPSASLFLHNQVNRVFDIVGFAKEEKEQYIADSLRDATKQNELHQYLKQYPVINAYCYVPLHLAMVIFLLKRSNLPETLTKMNEMFILQTIHRNLQQRNKQYKKLSLNRFDDLPSEVLNIILLSKLAYDGVQGSKLVFTLEEIKLVCPEADDILATMNGLGLLQAVKHYNPLAVTEVTASFNFLHYSMQEYLAAFYISTLSNADQYSIMISVKPLHYALSAAQRKSTSVSSFWHNHFVFMWLMYVGITCGQAHAFILFLGNSGFFATTGKASNKPILPLDIMQILHVFQCFVEANNVKACNLLFEHIFRDGNIYIRSAELSNMPLFSHHILSLVFFLIKSPRSYKSLGFANCFFLDDAINTLEEYFLMYPAKASTIKTVHFENSCFVSNSKILGTIFKGGYVSNISIANVGNCNISNMINSLGGNHNLNALTIQQMELKDNSIELLIQQLLGTKLKVLNLANNMCTSTGMRSIANFVGENLVLLALTLSDNMVGVSKEIMPFLAKRIIPDNFLELYNDRAGLEVLASALKKNPPLLSLKLSNNCILFVKELAMALYYNRVLMSLDLSSNFLHCDDQSSYTELGKALRVNEVLQSLNISQNAIFEAKMQNVIYALYYNKMLQSLDVSANGLGYKATEDLAHALMYNSHLSLLVLGSNSIGDEGAIHLSSALKLNTTITSLYLRDNMITNVGAVEIAIALKNNRVLQKLDMSMNDISDEGVSVLCKTFYVANTLKVLYLVLNPINSRDIVTEFASKDTTYYWQSHVPMTNYIYAQSITKINNKDKKVEYSQKLPVQTTVNFPIWYGITTDKRTLVFTFDLALYKNWKSCSHRNIHLQYMYTHVSIHYPNKTLEEECLQCYTQTMFNPL